MKLISISKFAIFLTSLALSAASLQATDKALLDALVAKGTLTKEEAAEIAKKSKVNVTPNRPTISELKVRGRIQGQYAFSSGDNSNVSGEPASYSSFEARRVRLGVQGKLYEPFTFQVEMNALSSVDLDSALISYTAIPEANITFGKDKPQFGYEENTSSASILSIERSRLTGLFNGGKPLGLRVHGKNGIVSYYAGYFNGSSVATDRMARNMDGYLANLSVSVNLKDKVAKGVRGLIRADFLHSDKATNYYRFEDAFSLSTAWGYEAFDISAEYNWGETFAGNKVSGFMIQPSYFFIPKKFQGVLRFEVIDGDGMNIGHNRYADRVSNLFGSGDEYSAIYLGGNYYIQGDNLKFMAGIEFATVEGSNNREGKAVTFISGVRMQF
jgi:hypothetical protein